MVDHRLIIDPPASGAWNMAVDEALLIDAAESGVATLRFYQWKEPTLSLGYFQAYEERLQHAASRECACVRRQTGGGAIVHDREITYSIVLPPGHPCSHRSTELYAKVHDAVIAALNDATHATGPRINLQRVREVSTAQSADLPFLCFERRAIGDVVATPSSVWHISNVSDLRSKHWKILGSAQRRSRGALLQHGSLLLRQSAAAPELAGFYDMAGEEVSTTNPAQLIPFFEGALWMKFSPSKLPQTAELIVHHLANTKYGNATWTNRR